MNTRGTPAPSFDAELGSRVDRAIAGETRPLYDLLTRNSGLPGPRVHERTVDAFARACTARGTKGDRLAAAMAALDADEAPGATELEILPVCAVAAIAARAASDPKRIDASLALLHDRADDLRFRVREQVPLALAHIGAAAGDALVAKLDGWMDGFFHAAAVVRALAMPGWLNGLQDADAALGRLDEAWALAREAPRAAARYPGYKALVEVLAVTPAAIAGRFGTPAFDRYVAWATVKEPALRDALAANLRGAKMAGRLKEGADRVRRALEASTPAPRDPTLRVQGTRQRSRTKRR